MSHYRKGIIATAMMLCGIGGASAADSVTLTFNRMGSNASSVAVSVDGIEGVTATLNSVSPDMKSTGGNVTASILCPDVNGNTSPTITFVMTLSGLPAGFSFNTVGLDIHAFNATGSYQAANDNKTREWNVDIETGASESSLDYFSSLTNIDIAANVNSSASDRHKVWFAESVEKVTASSPLTIKLTVSKGNTNEGCFFGLSAVSLSTGEVEPTPPTPPTPPEPVEIEGKVYTIKWKNNTSSYMTEAADGGIVIGSYSPFSKVFWEFIPTEKDNCYYIRNTASGLYIGSCNMTPSSASKVKMSATPVEYYVHQSASTSGENQGCWWMSSTDCANYDKETSGARCLNKDGASSSIITWTTALTNYGSYWSLAETENLYEERAFTPSAAVGAPEYLYHILDATSNKALTSTMNWQQKADVKEQRWYFVGTSNAEGGYQIVNSDNVAVNSGTAYKVSRSTNGYKFTDAAGTVLSLNGVTEFNFSAIRSDFARALKVYKMPCGSTGSNWIAQVKAPYDGYSYPLPTKGTGRVNYPLASKPSRSFEVFSQDYLNVDLAGTELNIILGTSAQKNTVLSVHMDYDGDGTFDYSETVPVNGRNATVTVRDESGDFSVGRVRLRLDENGSTDPEADVTGETLDLKAWFHGSSELIPEIYVDVNDPNRGKAENIGFGVIEATPFGTSLFICWKVDNRVISTDARCENVRDTSYPVVYTAYFSPNLDDMSGIDNAVLSKVDENAVVEFNGNEISVISGSAVRNILVFGTDGNLAAANSGKSTLSVAGIQSGVYIVKAITASGVATLKIAK